MDVDLIARRRRRHVRRSAPADRAVGRHVDRQGVARAPGQRRGRGPRPGQRRQVHDLPGDGPRRGRRRRSGPTRPAAAERDGGAADHRRGASLRAGRARDAARHRLGDRARTPHARWWTATGRRRAAVLAVGAERRQRPRRPLVDGFPYLEAEVAWAVEHELAQTLDDVLVRRIRLAPELRDRGASIAPRVAAIMAPLLGWDDAAVRPARSRPTWTAPTASSTCRHDRSHGGPRAGPGHDVVARDRLRPLGHPGRQRPARVPAGVPVAGPRHPRPRRHLDEPARASPGRSWRRSAAPESVAAIGITNQRETTVVWERATGRPVAPAIVWQSRITAPFCERLRADGPRAVRPRAHRACRSTPTSPARRSGTSSRRAASAVARRARRARVRDGRLRGSSASLTEGGVHATDVSNASRTLLFDIHTLDWDDDLLRLMEVPRAMLPAVRPSSAVWAETDADVFGRADPDRGRRGRPAGGDVRPGVLRAGRGQEHLRDRGVPARERGRRAGRERSRAAVDRAVAARRAARRSPTRSRARCSSPAPPSSGCATA